MAPQKYKSSRSHLKGARHELMAASHYLTMGFNVFWPTCQQMVVDFIVMRDDGLKTVQVKTASWSKSGKFSYLQCRTQSTGTLVGTEKPRDLYDIFFIVAMSRDKTKTMLWEIPTEKLDSTNICLEGSNPNYKLKQWERFKVATFSHLPTNYKNENN